MAINSIPPILSPSIAHAAAQPAGPRGGDFQALLGQALGNVESGQQKTAAIMDRFLSGEDTEVHQVAMVAQKAEMKFDLFMQVRNKVIAAYQEVMKMQM
jgi:flagellar hook-basal body complex protein FliE